MAYQTGSATDLGDLLSKLDTFLVANGWTQDDFDDGASVATEGYAQWNKNSMHIGMKWVANSPNNLSLHQALGNAGAVFPGAHTDDSGNGYNASFGSDAQLDDERCVNDIGDGPFASYHFFENDASPAYVHVVVQISSQVYRHFGWGEMNKFNDWTGGEYCYGHYATEITGADAVENNATLFCDAIFASTGVSSRRAATIHAEGLPHQTAGEKWLTCVGGATALDASNWLDTAGNQQRHAFGGARGGPVAFPLGNNRADIASGHIPLSPLAIFTWDHSNDFVYYLGELPDIRHIEIFNFSAEQEVTIGSDTWVIFPQVRRTEVSSRERTYYSGFAYKKVTT